jgi:ankyrin repeat protein
VETARVLVAGKADVNRGAGQYGATPLLAASMNGYSKVANFLLSCKADVDKDIAEHRDYVGLDLLMVERQFPHRADTISTAAWMRVEGGTTPVCVAARNGQTRIVRLLVQAKCDTGKRVTWYGWTPLHYAAAEGHCEIVRLLHRAACAQADEAPDQEHVAEARSFQQKWAVRGAYKVRAGATFMDVAHTCGVADKVSQALM